MQLIYLYIGLARPNEQVLNGCSSFNFTGIGMKKKEGKIVAENGKFYFLILRTSNGKMCSGESVHENQCIPGGSP